MPRGLGDAQPLRLQVGVEVGVVGRLVTERAADAERERAAGKVEQVARGAYVDRVQVGRRGLGEHGRERGPHRRAVRRRVDEAVAARIDRVDQRRIVDLADRGVVEEGVRRDDVGVETPPESIAFQSSDHARDMIVDRGLAGDIAECVVDQRRLALGRERIIRVERAVRERRGQGDAVGVGRNRVLDLRGLQVHRDEVVEIAAADVRLQVRRKLGGGATVETEAPVGGRVVVVLHQGLRAVDVAVPVRGGARAPAARAQRLRHGARVGEAGGRVARRGQHARRDRAVDRARVQSGLAADQVVAADRRQVGGVEWIAALADADAIVLLVFEAAVDVVLVGREVADAEGSAGAALEAAAVLRIAEFRVGLHAGEGRLQQDVDHAADGVGAVDRRGAVLQHLDAVQDADRDGVEVDEAALAVVGQGVRRGARPVDQHQRRVDGQAAQGDARGACGEAVAERRRNGAAVVGRDRADRVGDGGDAGVADLLRGELGHGRRRLAVGAAEQRAGDHHLLHRGRRVSRFGRGGLAGRGNRR